MAFFPVLFAARAASGRESRSKLSAQRASVVRSARGASPPFREASMDWIISLVVGGIIGWVASLIMKTDVQMGIIANVLVGIVGSALGYWLAGLLGISAGGIGAWLVALAGAVILIAILRALGIFKK